MRRIELWMLGLLCITLGAFGIYFAEVGLLNAQEPKNFDKPFGVGQVEFVSGVEGRSDPSDQSVMKVSVPAQVTGVISEVRVKVGDRVTKGQLLGRIDDRLAQIELERKTIAAVNDADLLDAIARQKEAKAQLDETKRLYEMRIESSAKYRIAQAGLEIAEYAVKQAEVERKLALVDKKEAELRLSMHMIESPIDGIVTERLKHPGEAVELHETVFRVRKISNDALEKAAP